MICLMLCDHFRSHDQQCMTSDLQFWYWHVVPRSVLDLFWSLALCLVIDLLCPTTCQFFKPKNGHCPVRSRLCLLFVPLEMNHSSISLSWRSSVGGGVLGCGCCYWLALCVLCAVMMGCYISNPTAAWPQSSHTMTLCSAQQQGCENTMPDICLPPLEWNIFSV